jgi:hypothetical protein
MRVASERSEHAVSVRCNELFGGFLVCFVKQLIVSFFACYAFHK